MCGNCVAMVRLDPRLCDLLGVPLPAKHWTAFTSLTNLAEIVWGLDPGVFCELAGIDPAEDVWDAKRDLWKAQPELFWTALGADLGPGPSVVFQDGVVRCEVVGVPVYLVESSEKLRLERPHEPSSSRQHTVTMEPAVTCSG